MWYRILIIGSENNLFEVACDSSELKDYQILFAENHISGLGEFFRSIDNNNGFDIIITDLSSSVFSRSEPKINIESCWGLTERIRVWQKDQVIWVIKSHKYKEYENLEDIIEADRVINMTQKTEEAQNDLLMSLIEFLKRKEQEYEKKLFCEEKG